MTTRTAAIALLATPLAALALSGTAAQAVSSPVPLSVQVGIGTQLSSSAKNAVSSTSFHAGASLTLTNGSTLFVLPGTQGLDVDYNHASGHDSHFDAYGLTYTNRISLVPKAAQTLTAHVVPYVGFGLGVYQADVHTKTTTTTTTGGEDLSARPEQTTTTTTTEQSKSRTNIGGKLMAGVGVANGAFFEVSYIISGSAAGVRTDSLNFAVGTHF